MNATQLLYEKFGYTSFRPGQEETIESLLLNKHTLSMLPTGTGKSLCYQLPAYLLSGSVLIVSPLLSLMQDQAEQMKIRGEKSVIALNSFLSFQEKRQAYKTLPQYRFIFLSPEMLANQQVISILQSMRIALFVVDEAHCISQWGHDFRPDYRLLGEARAKLGNPLTLALTATAAPNVRKDIFKYLNIEQGRELVFSVDRPNIAMAVWNVMNMAEKKQRLAELCQQLKKPGIVYFSSKKGAEEGAEYLRTKGMSRTAFYHGGMNQEDRILIQQQFQNDELDIICATSAFGMGINKNNIHFVIHFHLPSEFESYLQEIGRAGRGGEDSLAILLYSAGDEDLHYLIATKEFPSDGQINRYTELADDMVPGEIDVLLQLNESQARFIRHYLTEANKAGLQDAADFIRKKRDQQLLKKEEKRKQMLNWIHCEGCRREAALAYFAETLTARPVKCCDHCGLDFNLYQKRLIEEEKEVNESWDSILASIFSIKG
ncbi:ATP-dependent DNA helicase RecQ [Bacillus ectoiniformans]|uniref:RecQ family ATP-dependent DNA helicase n=1 Tax=Bacillus ectoiniformans TaxID=1494429 RepID=UPI00195B1BC1|nr:ATP-dependent DNA helicase RecQ [Bacillus ectoiniformans]